MATIKNHTTWIMETQNSNVLPKRRTVRGKSLAGIVQNFDELLLLIHSWNRGVSSYSKTFSFCFAIHFATTILNTSEFEQNLASNTVISSGRPKNFEKHCKHTQIHKNWSRYFLRRSKNVCRRPWHHWILATAKTQTNNDSWKLLHYHRICTYRNSWRRMKTEESTLRQLIW